jgi:hypothetical protein
VTTSTAVSPFVVSEITEVELADGGGNKKVWKKQILPAGTRQYKGQTLDFSKINPACLTAFDDKAFDGVPFVLALSDNRHPDKGDEGKQLEGDVYKLELGEDGSLFGYFDLSHSPGVEQTIRKSGGKFGVSGRIEVDYTAEDTGRHFDYALSHVCGTTRPHIKGLANWQPVELSEEEKNRPIIDFSTEVEDVPKEEKKETKPNDQETGDDLVAVEIPKEKLDKLLALLDDDLDDDEMEETADDVEKKQELPPAAQAQIAAAEAASARALQLAETMQMSAAEERWTAQRATYLKDGVPPVLLNLAETVMKRHKPVTLEFAEGDTVDATEVVKKILDECKGFLALSDERGHSFSAPQENAEYSKLEQDFMDQWQYDGRNA